MRRSVVAAGVGLGCGVAACGVPDAPARPRPAAPVVAAAGCDGNLLGSDAPIALPVGGRLRRPVTGPPRSLSYYAANSVDVAEVHRLISDRLARRDEAHPDQFRPELATCVRRRDGGFEVMLRPGVSWSSSTDGAVTAEDVAMALAVVAEPSNGGRAAALRAALGPMTWEVRGDGALWVKLAGEGPGALAALMAIQPVPSKRFGGIAQASSYGDHPVTDYVVGSGPYRYAGLAGDDLVFVRNPGHWGPPAAFDEIRHVSAPDPSGWPRLLTAGAVDVAFLKAEAWRALTPDPGAALGDADVVVGESPAASWFYLGFNLDDPVFADVRVRRALAMALDRDALVNGVFSGFGRRISGPFLPGSPCADPEVVDTAFDVTAAGALLDAAGFVDSDGVRARRGVPLSFSVLLWEGSPDWEAVGLTWQAALRPLGVRVSLEPVPAPVMQARLDAGAFQVFTGSWAPDPEIELRSQWHSSVAGTSNRLRLRDAALDALLDASERGEPSARVAACRAAHRRIAELQPAVWVYARDRVPTLSRRGLALRYPGAEPFRDARYWSWTP